jgi:hypothetical protein
VYPGDRLPRRICHALPVLAANSCMDPRPYFRLMLSIVLINVPEAVFDPPAFRDWTYLVPPLISKYDI